MSVWEEMGDDGRQTMRKFFIAHTGDIETDSAKLEGYAQLIAGLGGPAEEVTRIRQAVRKFAEHVVNNDQTIKRNDLGEIGRALTLIAHLEGSE